MVELEAFCQRNFNSDLKGPHQIKFSAFNFVFGGSNIKVTKYLPIKLFLRSPGYDPVPPSFSPLSSSVNVPSGREWALNEQSPFDQLAKMTFAQYPQSVFLPFQYPGANLVIPKAQLEAHEILNNNKLRLSCLFSNNRNRKIASRCLYSLPVVTGT